MAEQLGRLGLRGRWGKEDAADAAGAGDAVLKSQRALGQVRAPHQAPCAHPHRQTPCAAARPGPGFLAALSLGIVLNA